MGFLFGFFGDTKSDCTVPTEVAGSVLPHRAVRCDGNVHRAERKLWLASATSVAIAMSRMFEGFSIVENPEFS